MVKDIATILKELGINLESETLLEDTINKLLEYSVVNENELLGIQNVSVQPLPTIIKNDEKNLKQRMVGIVSDQEKGAVSIINKRIVLLSKIIEALKSVIDDTNNEIDILKSYNLGVITIQPTTPNNNELNITETGVYHFVHNNTPYIMFVNRISYNRFAQVVMYGDHSLKYFTRTYDGSSWTITEEKQIIDKSYVDELVEPISKTANENYYAIQSVKFNVNLLTNNKADKTYVEERIAQLVGSAPETLDTLDEIAKALQENDNVVDVLNESIANKADKSYVDEKIGNIQTLLEAI